MKVMDELKLLNSFLTLWCFNRNVQTLHEVHPLQLALVRQPEPVMPFLHELLVHLLAHPGLTRKIFVSKMDGEPFTHALYNMYKPYE